MGFTEDKAALLNSFLVEVFNQILKTEELSIDLEGFKNLSLKELHVIEAVCIGGEQGRDNCSAAIAESLRITPGTLTIAVALLEKKGYLIRHRDEKDKRIVRISPTDLGRRANACHGRFHDEMIKDILSILNEDEAAVFIRALGCISSFFRAKNTKS